MPKSRPAASGYARIAQEEEQHGPSFHDDSDDDDIARIPTTLSVPNTQYMPIQPSGHNSMHASGFLSPPEIRKSGPSKRRMRSNSSGIDITAINARLERWADEIASKFKIGKNKGKLGGQGPLEIVHSVFQPPDGLRPLSEEALETTFNQTANGRMTKAQFEEIIKSVEVAIEQGIHPTMISQGSSGSYFARNVEGTIVGVFKPKDEEPYASRNPKWTKWIHRNLFPCFFGRACLIPNLSYVSEAAAYTLDSRLQTNLVPYTDIVRLSSKSFFYDFWDRRKYYRKRKPFPQKVGSFQVFLKGFKDANIFFRDHPWPDQQKANIQADRKSKKSKPWTETCRPSGAESDDEELEDDSGVTAEESNRRKFFWTPALQESFREELEKLVILDYIMRNTDRGLDNWMIKVDWQNQKVSMVAEPPKTADELEDDELPARPVIKHSETTNTQEEGNLQPYRVQQPMDASSRSSTPLNSMAPIMSIGAIDNSLSWPWKHPDAWRSFPFGWLFLPVSLIGRPFSQKSRDHFLPLLTSTKWWSDTQLALRSVFSQDSDFAERMFARQIAVMKGQAWNVVETLKTPDHGPLELTRRPRVYVWDDLVEIPVAVPMRAPSAEMRARNTDLRASVEEEEEMDISAASASMPPSQQDLLGLLNPSTELPHPGRFDLSSASSTADIKAGDSSTSKSLPKAQGDENDQQNSSKTKFNVRPKHVRSKTRVSLDEPNNGLRRSPVSVRRRLSLSNRNLSAGLFYDGDDLEGDLGYSAAEGMEKNQRKVIVERLEMVKGRNPVFTCF